MELLAKQLATAMPTLRAPRVWLSVLNEAMERFEIASSAHIAAFLVQVARDSKECRYLEDDLRYPAEALMRMWPQHFPTLATAHPYARNPEKLANVSTGARSVTRRFCAAPSSAYPSAMPQMTFCVSGMPSSFCTTA